MSFDLHTHSVWSDGTTTPEENAALAAAAGLRGIALTDHDTVDGWPEMAGACARHGVEFVPGVELSTQDHGRGVHLLGYWVDPEDRDLARTMSWLREARQHRVVQIVAKLRSSGIGVTLDRVRATAADGAPLGRSHIAAALVEIGAVDDMHAAFDRLLGEGRPAYVPKQALAPEDGAALIVSAGGVAVLAHPGRSGVDTALLDRLARARLAGVEADHPNHAGSVAVSWRRAAHERELLTTGSSDFHGTRKAVRIGERTTPDQVVEALRAQKRQEARSW